ncbi:peroxiredoxin [Allomuricauda sp. SCSIO 65647]|uniref:peroxiredoxin family protein n=1 Tax=Allomuricauda sp. SCSIO 65647 TaxID=2908843 RepID=UPI001F2983D2|nr:TlpA disulfide reductase family protein [Muricauda sp. SCSIO 65647]UJH67555.1 TlpA family protein disulfide reductase [Muricauda sp. SCSIO 65647]
MKRLRLSILVMLLVCSCQEKKSVQLKEGSWWAKMQVSENEILPFNLDVTKNNGHYVFKVKNGEERVSVDEIAINGDSIIIKMPVFEGYIAGTFSDTEIIGDFIKESLDRVVPFTATFGERPRFDSSKPPLTNISGIWETVFDYDTGNPYMAKGIFVQNDEKVTGTFRTTTGDYRYLEGVVDGDSLKLSTFDGAHAFLFVANATDSTLDGHFYSGNHSVEKFMARRNEGYELPDANSLTFLRKDFERFDFSFPDVNGNVVGMGDEAFKQKVVLVQIMGTWCPNCLDETKFYVDYLKKNPHPDLKMIALAFEYAKTKEKAFEGIKRLKDRVGVPYPILLAQFGTSSKLKANEKLPMLNHVLSYPTTIYIDKKGKVRKIHTGFNGPATGEKYEAFKIDFEETVSDLLSE